MTLARWSWAMKQELPAGPKYLLEAIADGIGGAPSYPFSIEKFVARCGFTPLEAIRNLLELERRGYVTFNPKALYAVKFDVSVNFPEGLV